MQREPEIKQVRDDWTSSQTLTHSKVWRLGWLFSNHDRFYRVGPLALQLLKSLSALDITMVLAANPSAHSQRGAYFGLIPISFCASLKIERSAMLARGISRSIFAVFFASSTIKRNPASGREPSSLKLRTALS